MKKKCIKCGYESDKNKSQFNKFLCEICYKFSPDDGIDFSNYIHEKIDGTLLETFRKYKKFSEENKKTSMLKKAAQGNLMSRAPFGYKIENKQLVPAQNFREIEEIFEEFLTKNISLTQLAKKHNLSVNGLKKILKNFTYIGKIKFNNQIHAGNHQPIISSTLFNHVQNKIERLGIK